MYWVYFARDFYRSSKGEAHGVATATAQKTCLTHEVAPASDPIPTSTKRAHTIAKRQVEHVIKSAIVESPTAIHTHTPLLTCLHRLSEEGDHAFGLWDEARGFSLFSANFERVTGLSAQECSGHEWIHRIHHTQQYAANEAMLNALIGIEGSCLLEMAKLKEDAPSRWIRMEVKAAMPKNRQVLVLFLDLSAQKALETALEETKSALAISERSRAAFLASMSHELRTPLNAIMGFSEMMKSQVFGEIGNATYLDYARHIHESGTNLLAKINDLLSIASMDAGGMQLEEAEFFLKGMLEEAVAMHTHSAFARGQQIVLECPYAIEMLGDRAKLLCGVAHLLANALRHSADGAEVRLNVSIQPDEGVVLSVRDMGEGISSAQLDIIREALAAQEAYFKIECGGIGLGLSITKELAQRHGGRVMIDSVRHHGTVASLILPLGRVTAGMPKLRRGALARPLEMC